MKTAEDAEELLDSYIGADLQSLRRKISKASAYSASSAVLVLG
jgi:hypothetical protein